MVRPILCIIVILLGPTSALTEESLRVMSFNIRYGSANDGENRWDLRKPLVVQAIQQFHPDLLGTQETLKFQADFLAEQLGDYVYFGRSRMKTPNEHCGIFYRQDRFTWLAGGHFWLSEAPEVPESKSWDSSLPRMASWVLLNHKMAEHSPPILFVNTHFDHQGKIARLESARLIRNRIEQLRKIANSPHIIVTGDFNTAEGSEPYHAFLQDNNQLVDTYRSKHPDRKGSEGTFNGFQGRTEGGRIDWILASPSLITNEAAIDIFSLDGRYPSDHFPVTAVLSTR